MTLTLFTAPKPFTDPHIATIQRNAIRNWLRLEGVDVLLVGDEPGLAETAAEFGVAHLRDVERNEWGTPLIPSIFALAREHSDAPILAYVNADMLFLPDFVEAAQQVATQAERFLMVGQRWDLDVTAELDFASGWAARLRERVAREGLLHPPAGSDYFIFPRDAFTEMPAFAIGRAGWDNWMIYRARALGWPVVDGTPSILAIHQNHDYSHLPGGRPHYDLEESHRNTALAGGERHMYTLFECSHVLREGRLRPAPLTLPRLLRRLELWLLPPTGKARGLRRFLLRRVRRTRRRLTA
ncbi:MAG TPA: hypothetical protein ENJ02_08395 [Chloroflexi bacterium]|nr:hypothetical protein [Chloroflexota bacterium]